MPGTLKSNGAAIAAELATINFLLLEFKSFSAIPYLSPLVAAFEKLLGSNLFSTISTEM
jgi:hypothetical protein